MKKKEPKAYHHGNLRDELLKTAGRMISKHGMKALTLRALAQRVGVSRSAPYRHFANKNALLMAIAEDGFRSLTKGYRRKEGIQPPDAAARLEMVGSAYVEFAIRHPGPYKLMFGAEIMEQPHASTMMEAARVTFDEFRSATASFRMEYGLEGVGLDALTNHLWTTAHGLAMLLIDGQIDPAAGKAGVPGLLSPAAAHPGKAIEANIAYAKTSVSAFINLLSQKGGSTR